MTSVDLPRPGVPAPIAVVRDFVNTTDHETGTDDLTTRAALVTYLLQEGLLTRPARATTADLELAIELRAGLRGALEQNHAGASGDTVPELSGPLARLPVRLDWTDSGPVVRADGADVRAALARIVLAALEAAGEGSWWRLKICSSDECEWAYYDHSKNRSRAWCEYGCGNKAKTRAYRARQRTSG